MTAALQAVIDAALPGTEIRFRKDARYRVDGTLLIDGRERVVIDGQGATLAARERGEGSDRAMWPLRAARASRFGI